MSQPVYLAITPDNPVVGPGERQILMLTVTNTSAIVDRFTLTLQGVAEDWYTLSEPSVSLFPGTSRSIPITLHPPADAGIRAGDYPITIGLQSTVDPAHSAVTTAGVQVKATGALCMDVRPTVAEGRSATFRVAFVNQMNTDVSVALQVRDDEDGLEYGIGPAELVEVAAGASAALTVAVAPRVREAFGEPHPYTIEFQGRILGNDADAPPDPRLMQQARYTYTPRWTALAMPLWIRRLPGWAILAALLLLLALVFFGGNRTATLLASAAATSTAVATETPLSAQATASAASATAGTVGTAGSAATAPAGSGGMPTPVATALGEGVLGQPPSIRQFTVQGGPRGGSTVAWTVLNARQVFLDGRLVPASGSGPLKGSTTILSASNGKGSTVSQVLQIAPTATPQPPHDVRTLLFLPHITQFTAAPGGTGTVRLSWRVANASSVTLDGVHVPEVGSRTIAVDRPMAAHLLATNALGSHTATLAIAGPGALPIAHVRLALPAVERFALQHPRDGQPYEVVWQTRDGDRQTLDGRAVGASGTLSLQPPLSAHTYILVVTNSVGQARAQLQLSIR